ncbi:MAG: phosphohistidine phosphatase SixA [Phycisphaeraceae bacterium]
MRLYVFRHGIAEPSQPGVLDAGRELTPRGYERTLAAAQGLARFADRPQVILTSPKIRARQTAGILGDVFDLVPQIVEELGEGSAVQIIHMLRHREETSVMIVGHEPTLSEVIETLCTQKTLPGFIELKKAACALLDAPLHPDDAPGPARLKWLLPPRALRTMAGSAD